MKNRKQKNLETKVTPEEFYSELTDPRNHNPDNYCYIVHCLNPIVKNLLLLEIVKQGSYDCSQNIDLLYQPKRISEKKLISNNIINQGHTATWGSTFFILDVPWSNFVSMNYTDTVTNVIRPDSVLERARKPYQTPSELIKSTKALNDSNYNEVVVTGNKNGNKVKIKGIGIKLTDCEDRIRATEKAERMRENAEYLNVPVIEFMGISRIEDSEPEVYHGYLSEGEPVRSIYVSKNGYRYFFEGDWDKTQLKDAAKSDKNFYGGHNPVSKKEYLELRPQIRNKLSTKKDLEFLKQIDKWFKVKGRR